VAEFNCVRCLGIRSDKRCPKIEPEAVQQAAEVTNQAKKPFVLSGQGVIIGKAEEELKAFLDKTGIPAANTLLGTGALSEDHPLYVGKLGMHGNYAPNILTNHCDVLIAIGMRFDDRVTGDLSRYAKQAKVIHLELDPAEINKIMKCEVAVLGDCKESLKMLVDEVVENRHEEWIKQFKELEAEERKMVLANYLSPSKAGLTMAEVINNINEFKADDAILVTDVGQHQMVAWRYFDYRKT